MSADTQIADGKVVWIHYTLRDDQGEIIDQSDEGDPLAYLHGAENIVPGLERALLGRAVGDKLDVAVAPADGYGERRPGQEQTIARSEFPDDAEIFEGMQIALEGPEGELVPVWIAAIEDDTITLDLNHPLAGQVLHFAVEVMAVRDATAEEQAHGHPHDGDHHHH
jgi:FKBP-type peptidyl-prolyl cis-trans isomerase SlyD